LLCVASFRLSRSNIQFVANETLFCPFHESFRIFAEIREKNYNFCQQVFTFLWVANITVTYCEKDTTTDQLLNKLNSIDYSITQAIIQLVNNFLRKHEKFNMDKNFMFRSELNTMFGFLSFI